MDFSYETEHVYAQSQISDFVHAEINPDLGVQADPKKFDRNLWLRFADAGFFALGMPDDWTQEYRNSAGKYTQIRAALLAKNHYLSQVVALEALGYCCDDSGLPFALAVQGSTVQQTILQHGTKSQHTRYLPACIAGKLIGAHAMTEPAAGSDTSAIAVQAEKTSAGYVLNGCKTMITLAPVADFYIVFATIDPQTGRWGQTAFLVDRDTPGVRASEPNEKLGLTSVPIGALEFEHCVIPEAQRLGPEGAGAAIAQHSLESERSTVLASHVGQMRKQLEHALAHARNRKQFGQSIAEFQSVSNRLADMRLRLETTQLLLYKTAWLRDQGKSSQLESSMLKLLISENFLSSSIDAMRIQGGYAFIENHPSSVNTRDALGSVLYAGTSDIQRNIIAGLLAV